MKKDNKDKYNPKEDRLDIDNPSDIRVSLYEFQRHTRSTNYILDREPIDYQNTKINQKSEQ
ncbi:MAG: hypothetical protein Q7S74_00320 [Nanoarchaeota archaeon]|nr:hypothetical protein [Nanoarchaeota archaeon]